ncbi:nuclear transport factor 2 family protein [Rhodococcus sp. NPDC003322]
MTDSQRMIEDLVYEYADRIDAGDLDGVAALFTHGRVCGVENGPPETVFNGADEVRQMYSNVILYEDGTPGTKHMTSNVRVTVDDRGGSAQATSYFLVTQSAPDHSITIIAAGRYRDSFRRLGETWWFDTRVIIVDQWGDQSRHLRP